MRESRNEVLQVRECPACRNRDTVHSGELNGYSLVRCERCKLVYTAVAPTEEQLTQVYNQVYQDGEIYSTKLTRLKAIIADGHSRQGFYLNRVFLKRIVPKTGDKLLETGCGTGDFLMAARERG